MIDALEQNNDIKFDETDPIVLFNKWFKQASDAEPLNPNACALATADKSGNPGVRMVLLKGIDKRGFVFYSNSGSQKGKEMAQNRRASLCFYWKSLRRQVRIDGKVNKVSIKESNEYFATRSRESQIGAWASKQSEVMASRVDLEDRFDYFKKKFESRQVTRPESWVGYRIKHEIVEFWAERSFRLHDRFIYRRTSRGWRTERIFP